jgi:phosphatidylglycerophosphatase A
LTRIALVLATWFGCGYFPYGPGTVGSLAGLLVAALVENYLWGTRLFLFGSIFVLLMPAFWASTVAAKALGRKDPGQVVIDEVLGQWVTLLGAVSYNWPHLLAGFALFRLFDIWKPWPVRQFEKLPDGYGIVADDLMAGVYAALILYIGGQAVSLLGS